MTANRSNRNGGVIVAPYVGCQPETDEGCDSCRFWFGFESWISLRTGEVVGNFGICKRRAPPPYLGVREDEDECTARWPITEDINWCGEHEPRP